MSEAAASQVEAVVAKISPLLKGNSPEVQSAVLGDLLSMFLSGHFIVEPDGSIHEADTAKVRAQILQEIVSLAFKLLPLNTAMILRSHEGQAHVRRRPQYDQPVEPTEPDAHSS
jgi:hypothetical protein